MTDRAEIGALRDALVEASLRWYEAGGGYLLGEREYEAWCTAAGRLWRARVSEGESGGGKMSNAEIGYPVSRAEALRISRETLERAERERLQMTEQTQCPSECGSFDWCAECGKLTGCPYWACALPSAPDATKDAVVAAACELRAARKAHDRLHMKPAMSENESRYAATLLLRIAHWSAALNAAVDEYNLAQEE